MAASRGRSAQPRPDSKSVVPAASGRPRLYLIDAYAYLFRAYHALPPLATSKGIPTGATYGFLTAILKVLREHKPSWVGVVWDAPGGSFRDSLYDDYKANRTVPPEDLSPQFGQVRQIANAMCIPNLEAKGFEADDVIATLTRQAVEADCDVAIVSGDKDLMCLVNDRVTVLDLVRFKTYDRAAVIEKFGVPPEHMTDYLALVGDASDNIPGVKGVGAKTAATLLNTYGSVESILADLEKVQPERVRKMIEASRADLELSRTLVKLSSDVPVTFDREAMTVRQPDVEQLRPLLMEFEFHRLIPQFAAPTEQKKAISRANNRIVLDEAALSEAIAEMKAAPRFAFDLQTNGASPFDATLVGISLCADPERAWYIPLTHRYLGAPAQLPESTALAALKDLLQDPDRPKIAQHSKYDRLVLERLGIDVRGFVSDPMIAGYVLNPERPVQGITELAKDLLEHKTIAFEEVAGRGARANLAEAPVEQAAGFAAEEAQVGFILASKIDSALAEIPTLEKLYRELESPLVPVLMDMERAGIKVDTAMLGDLSKTYEIAIREMEKRIYEAAGLEFNIASPIQLREVLFTRLKLPIIKRTKTGPSTDVDVLEKLAERHAVPSLILEHRSKSKLKSTYLDALPKLVRADGRVHTTFNQTVAATGRLSSSEPNLQNIPIRTEEGRKIRRAFVAADGCRFVGADYSQMELRLVAGLSGEPEMIEAFRNGEDIHSSTAKKVFGSDAPEFRSKAKAVNFGIIYGETPFGLANQLKVSRTEAAEYIAVYFARYQKVRAFLDDVLAGALRFGWVETKFGRRRPFNDIHSRNPMLREGARRQALNHPIQGTAADLMKLAMIAARRRLRDEGLQARMLLQIHDELIFETPAAEVEQVVALARETMESVAELAVPLKADVHTGLNWDEV